MRLPLLFATLLLATSAAAQSPPLRPGDTVPESVARQTFYALGDTVLVHAEASADSRVTLRLLRGAEVRTYSQSGSFYAVSQGDRAVGFVAMRDVGRSQPPIAVGPTVPATNADVLRLERRLRSVHRQTTFLTVVTAASLVLSGILLVNSL